MILCIILIINGQNFYCSYFGHPKMKSGFHSILGSTLIILVLAFPKLHGLLFVSERLGAIDGKLDIVKRRRKDDMLKKEKKNFMMMRKSSIL